MRRVSGWLACLFAGVVFGTILEILQVKSTGANIMLEIAGCFVLTWVAQPVGHATYDWLKGLL